MVFFSSLISTLAFSASVASAGLLEDWGRPGVAPAFREFLRDLKFTTDGHELELKFGKGRKLNLGFEPIAKLGRSCGMKTFEWEAFDAVVTGCPGEDRWITVGGIGSWHYDSKTKQFEATKAVEHGGDVALEAPEEDQDALIKKLLAQARQSSAALRNDASEDEMEAPQTAQNAKFEEEFSMEVRYYYDASMLKLHGTHEKTIYRILEIHEHSAVIMRHESIGRKVHIHTEAEPVFVDKRRNANGVKLEGFVLWLMQNDVCSADVAFHHLLTADGWDGTVGIAYVGTVCHRDCYNSGITEDGWNDGDIAYTARVMAHEMGHNLGMSHNFDEKHEGRGCKGYMSYGEDQDNATAWSPCANGDWNDNFEEHIQAFGKSRAERCMVPL